MHATDCLSSSSLLITKHEPVEQTVPSWCHAYHHRCWEKLFIRDCPWLLSVIISYMEKKQ